MHGATPTWGTDMNSALYVLLWGMCSVHTHWCPVILSRRLKILLEDLALRLLRGYMFCSVHPISLLIVKTAIKVVPHIHLPHSFSPSLPLSLPPSPLPPLSLPSPEAIPMYNVIENGGSAMHNNTLSSSGDVERKTSFLVSLNNDLYDLPNRREVAAYEEPVVCLSQYETIGDEEVCTCPTYCV